MTTKRKRTRQKCLKDARKFVAAAYDSAVAASDCSMDERDERFAHMEDVAKALKDAAAALGGKIIRAGKASWKSEPVWFEEPLDASVWELQTDDHWRVRAIYRPDRRWCVVEQAESPYDAKGAHFIAYEGDKEGDIGSSYFVGSRDSLGRAIKMVLGHVHKGGAAL